ncbi:MAG: response regulator, partial [Thermoanaerobaculia bacterium]|nr:response regulator [Thermoanaerobaculia bacterium]
MTAHGGTVLVVDDDPVNRAILVGSLEAQGYAAGVASDGREALRELRLGGYDVVLLDLVMPVMDGFEVLRTMKEDERLRSLPVIVVSALEEMESVVRCIEMGAADFLAKPFDPVLLRARLKSSLAAKRLDDVLLAHVAEIEGLAEQLKVRNRFIQETFGRYLSDAVVAEILESPDGLRLGGEKRTVTMLMSDLRGFSAMAERLAPEQVVRVINNYLGTMADVILEHDGTIDEFIGDSVLGFFGAPVARADDPRRAVSCALAMQKGMERVNRRNREEGLPAVEMGIAVHTGEVVVGNIGSEKRAKYGAVGSHVNLTARIEGYTCGGQVLISERTLREAGVGLVTGGSLSVRAKGFPEPVRVHDLLGLEEAPHLHLGRRGETLWPVDPPLGVVFTVLEGKRVGRDEEPAEIVALSAHGAVLRTTMTIEALSNLKLRVASPEGLLPGDLYAKVLLPAEGAAGVTRHRF